MDSAEIDLLNARNKISLYIGDEIYKKIANKERQLAAKLKYEEEHRYELHGLCADCANKQAKNS